MAEENTGHKDVPSGTGIKILLGMEIFLCLFIVPEIFAQGPLEELAEIMAAPLMPGLFHALYVFIAGRRVKTVYPKWRGYAIGTAVALSLGAVIAYVGAISDKFALVCAGYAILFAAELLLSVYHLKTRLGKRYALTYNQLLDAGYYEELKRKKKAEVERETAAIIETAKSAASEMRIPGKKVEPIEPAAPRIEKGLETEPKVTTHPESVTPPEPVTISEPVMPSKSATPPEPTRAAERKPEGGEKRPIGHRLKL